MKRKRRKVRGGFFLGAEALYNVVVNKKYALSAFLRSPNERIKHCQAIMKTERKGHGNIEMGGGATQVLK